MKKELQKARFRLLHLGVFFAIFVKEKPKTSSLKIHTVHAQPWLSGASILELCLCFLPPTPLWPQEVLLNLSMLQYCTSYIWAQIDQIHMGIKISHIDLEFIFLYMRFNLSFQTTAKPGRASQDKQ